MSFSDSRNKGQYDLNGRGHVLNLPTGIRMYLVSRLHDGSRKVRSYTPFFILNGAFPVDGSVGTTVKPIPTKLITQLTGQSILIKERKKRRR